MLLPSTYRRQSGLLIACAIMTGLTGCALARKGHDCDEGNHQYLGVQDVVCHGYQQPHWRYWNNEACQVDGYRQWITEADNLSAGPISSAETNGHAAITEGPPPVPVELPALPPAE